MTSPRISVVTPSFNQAPFLEATIQSVLNQEHTNLEYIVMDGGSTDGSVDIIKRHAYRLAFWTSGKDEGQYDAINKGFHRSTGDIMGWINSDDLHLPWTLSVVSDIFAAHPDIEWITSLYPVQANHLGQVVSCRYIGGYNSRLFTTGRSVWIQQESTFWRRSLWERAGGYIDHSLHFAGDFELWLRFMRHAEPVGVCTPLAAFRVHGNQKTGHSMHRYREEADKVLGRPVRGRTFAKAAIGARPLYALPSIIRTPLQILRILHPVPTLYWDGTSWARRTDYTA